MTPACLGEASRGKIHTKKEREWESMGKVLKEELTEERKEKKIYIRKCI